MVIPASAFPGRQGRLAFAYLATHHHPVTRDELADVIWRDRLPDAWDRHLSALVSKVRALLIRAGFDEEILSAAFGSYELRLPSESEVDIDAAVVYVEDADAALRTAQGDRALAAADVAANLARRPFLPGEESAWVERKRLQLRSTLVRALEIEVELLRKRGDLHDALRLAEEAISLEPFRESGYVNLMRVHLETGNRAESLRVYERCRALLASELGIGPSPETEAVYLDLLRAELPR